MPQHQINASLGSDSLRDSVKRVSVLSNEKFHGLRVGFSDGTLTLSANNPDRESSSDEIDMDYKGEPMELGFSSKYLADALSVVDGECQLHVGDSNSSMLITDSSNTRHVVMPMRL